MRVILGWSVVDGVDPDPDTWTTKHAVSVTVVGVRVVCESGAGGLVHVSGRASELLDRLVHGHVTWQHVLAHHKLQSLVSRTLIRLLSRCVVESVLLAIIRHLLVITATITITGFSIASGY